MLRVLSPFSFWEFVFPHRIYRFVFMLNLPISHVCLTPVNYVQIEPVIHGEVFFVFSPQVPISPLQLSNNVHVLNLICKYLWWHKLCFLWVSWRNVHHRCYSILYFIKFVYVLSWNKIELNWIELKLTKVTNKAMKCYQSNNTGGTSTYRCTTAGSDVLG